MIQSDFFVLADWVFLCYGKALNKIQWAVSSHFSFSYAAYEVGAQIVLAGLFWHHYRDYILQNAIYFA